MPNLMLYGSAVLIWLEKGDDPTRPGFDYTAIAPPPAPNPEAWWLLHEAITHAVTTVDKGGKQPWIKTGDEILNPDKIVEIFESMGNLSGKRP